MDKSIKTTWVMHIVFGFYRNNKLKVWFGSFVTFKSARDRGKRTKILKPIVRYGQITNIIS